LDWKKKILLLSVIFMFSCLPALHAESALDGFVKKAVMAKADIDRSAADLDKIKKEYNETGNKIQELKGQKNAGGFTGFINGIILKVYLSRGNRLGFKIYLLEAGVRALKEDYFTYVSLITEEYGTQVRDCFEKKCGDLKALCEKRMEWAAAADKDEDMLQIDLSSLKLINDYSQAAAKDVKDYLQKKIIQAEQRIYMLEEDRSILDIMKKAGLPESSAKKDKNAKKTAELKKLKKELQDELKKIK